VRKGFPLSRVEGNSSRQAHAKLPEGTYERELGKEGFFGPASHMHHTHPPTSWSEVEGPVRPRAFDTAALEGAQPCPWDAPILMRNAHTRIAFWRLNEAMPALARDADGDLLLFIHAGDGSVYCDYGHLRYRAGDYIVMPRGTMWRLAPSQGECAILLIEATNDGFSLPDRGMLGRHALFDPAMLDAPALDEEFRAQQGETPWDVRVKRREEISRVAYAFNPLDAVGWHGDLMPLRINWRDIRPVMSARYHLPPSAHTTFLAKRFVVCTFAPRPLESDPDALKLPFFHNNDDFDEVIFYHHGNFLSRDNIGAGWFTLHPSGITHGPHPKALKASQAGTRQATDEVAVMIDTRDPLDVRELGVGVEWPEYAESWKTP
jgi:homogentisate 1,2-dioxygenase